MVFLMVRKSARKGSTVGGRAKHATATQTTTTGHTTTLTPAHDAPYCSSFGISSAPCYCTNRPTIIHSTQTPPPLHHNPASNAAMSRLLYCLLYRIIIVARLAFTVLLPQKYLLAVLGTTRRKRTTTIISIRVLVVRAASRCRRYVVVYTPATIPINNCWLGSPCCSCFSEWPTAE